MELFLLLFSYRMEKKIKERIISLLELSQDFTISSRKCDNIY